MAAPALAAAANPGRGMKLAGGGAAMLWLLAACAPGGDVAPFEVRVTPQGYEVEGRTLSTPQQVAELIARRGVSHVRLVLDRDASPQQIDRAVLALQEAGTALGVVAEGRGK